MSSISFGNAWLLFIGIPLLALVLVPFFYSVRKENRNGHNLASMAIHVAMAVIVAFVAAGTSVVTVMTETRVYVLADVSYSARNRAEEMDDYIAGLRKELPANSKMGVICFGKDHELLTEAGGSLKSVSLSKVDKSETDLVGALEYAGSLFEDGVIKRIVVISDGRQTDTRDAGALRQAVSKLQAGGVRVDAVYLNDNLTDEKEMQISSVEAASSVYLNHKEQAVVSVQSSIEAQCIVTLLRGGTQVAQMAQKLNRGYNNVVFDLDTSVAGAFDYEARIVPANAEDDGVSLNNSYYFTQTVSDQVKVLLITESPADYAAAKRLYGERAQIDAYVNKYDVPYSVEMLCKYDEFMLSNVDLAKLANVTSFVSSLDTLVSVYGKSLVTVGDMCIQNKTQEELGSFQDMLPVRFGNNDKDPKLYVLLVDVSHSMFMATRMIIAKKAAGYLVENMQDNDEVCIITFAGDSRMPLPPIKLDKEENRKEVLDCINGLTGSQGTVIGAGLQRTFNAIRALDSEYAQKQVMLFSDGMNYDFKQNKSDLAVVRNMYAYGIVTSVLDVGRGGRDTSDSIIAETFLKQLNEAGGGEYYFVDKEEDVEKVVFGEIADDITESVIKQNSAITVERSADGVLEGIGASDIPYVSGYIYAREKGGADTVLSVKYEKANGGKIDVPLYAHRNYGNGKVASFTGGGLGGEWLTAWQNGADEAFFKNVFEENMPAVKNDCPYQTEAQNFGNFTKISVTPASYRKDAVAELRITLPNGESVQERLNFNTELLKYEFEFSTSQEGKYAVEIVYTYAGDTFVSDASFYNSYSSEYDAFTLYTPTELHKMVGGKGTVANDLGEMLHLENDPSEVGMYLYDLTPVLMIICVLLFVADIVVRKLKWNDIKSLFKKVGK